MIAEIKVVVLHLRAELRVTGCMHVVLDVVLHCSRYLD